MELHHSSVYSSLISPGDMQDEGQVFMFLDT